MNKILLDGEKVNYFVKESLPVLIHGEEGSGASLYTLSLIANFYAKGFAIVFLCGFPMAEEEFVKQVGNYDRKKVRFYTKEKVEEFKKIARSENTDELLIVIKNIELFGKDVLDLVKRKQNLIIAGNINNSGIRNKILEMEFNTKIYFSSFERVYLPILNKYEGFVIGDSYKGITNLEI